MTTMKKLKIIGIICFGVLAFAGITQCNAPGGENNLFARLVCLFIAIGLSFPPSQKSIKKQGKTMVFVSHSAESVKFLCDRAVWLSNGKIKMDGNTSDVLDEYIKECG